MKKKKKNFRQLVAEQIDWQTGRQTGALAGIYTTWSAVVKLWASPVFWVCYDSGICLAPISCLALEGRIPSKAKIWF